MVKQCKRCGLVFEAVGKTLHCSKACADETNRRYKQEWSRNRYPQRHLPRSLRRASGKAYYNTAELIEELRTKYATTAIDDIVDEWMDELFAGRRK